MRKLITVLGVNLQVEVRRVRYYEMIDRFSGNPVGLTVDPDPEDMIGYGVTIREISRKEYLKRRL